MSIFDKLKKTVNNAVKSNAAGALNAVTSKKETFIFAALPESLGDM